MNKLFLFLLVFVFSSFTTRIFSQELLLNKDVNSQRSRNDDERDYGYNGKNFLEGFYGFATLVPTVEDDSLAMLGRMRSFSLNLGMRYRRKLGTRLALGLDTRVDRSSFRLQQKSSNLLGFGATHRSQKMVVNTLQLEPFFRIGFGSKGIVFSKNIDIGFDVAWVWYSRLITKDVVDPQLNNGARRTKYSAINPDYINFYQTSLSLRYGSNESAIWIKYRLSDLFVPTSSVRKGEKLPELSPIAIGLELNTLKFKRNKDTTSKKP